MNDAPTQTPDETPGQAAAPTDSTPPAVPPAAEPPAVEPPAVEPAPVAADSEATTDDTPPPAKKTAAKKTAKKTAKKAPAKKAAAKKTAAKPAADDAATGDVNADSTAETAQPEATAKPAKRTAKAKAAAPADTAMLFQVPEATASSTAEDESQKPAKKAAAKKTAKKTAKANEAKSAAARGSEASGDDEQGATRAKRASKAAPKNAAETETAPASDVDETARAANDADQATPATAATDASSDAEAQTPAQQSGDVTSTAGDEQSDDHGDGADDHADGEGGEGSGNARRRRRRGGRRRRKPAGGSDGADSTDEHSEGGEVADEQAEKSGTSDADQKGDKSDDTSDEATDDGNGDDAHGEGGSSSSRRRRRRRRAGEGNGDSGDDPENTVTKVRKPRSPEDEITAVSGSTRLEAKKQRRREGREAGRRRAPIVSEAEFLARRESVERVMAVRQRTDLTQIAVLEDKVLVEHYVARESQTSLIGNVYLGRVQNVLPSMEAAFVDIGKGRNAVLYAGEVNWQALGHKDGQPRKIESVLQSGQTVLVQVTKDPIGHKGARLTSQVSLAGRFLVYVPDGTTSGISRKLPDTERARLKALLKEIVPESAGVIVRTAAEGASEEELTRDVERLKARWEEIEAKVAKGNAPQLLYGEPDLTLKVVRDLFTEDFAKLVVQGDDAWATVSEYVGQVAPDLAERLEHHETDEHTPDLFAKYRIDEQIAKGTDRKVWLPSGGSLIIDRTEAMTVVDVNTGKFTGSGGNLEETVTKNNLEAAEEIVRQLRLRDIGGIIVVDFIDMVLESNRDLVLRRLVECLGRDRTRHQVAEVTSLGLVQMTRKRIGTGLLEAFSETCSHCQGRGVIVHDLPIEPKRGGDGDDSRRGRRRKGGNGGNGSGGGKGETSETTPKPVPSPKDVAAMAKPAADTADVTKEDAAKNDAAPVEAAKDEPAKDEPAKDEPARDEPAGPTGPVVDERSVAEPTATAPIVAEPVVSEPAATPDQPTEVPAAPSVEQSAGEPAKETADEPAEPAAPAVGPATTTVVTRTRRRAASRPAGPPSAETPSTESSPETADTPDTATDGGVPETTVEHVPIKKKGGARKR